MLENTDQIRPLTVKPTIVRVLGWTNSILFLVCAVAAWKAGHGEVSPLFLLFVAIGIYVILFSGSLEMDNQTVSYRTPLAQYQIKWDEVTHIEIDKQGGNLVFCGENKRLTAIGPMFWRRKEKTEMLKLIGAEIQTRNIKTQQTEKAMFRLPKNTKIHF